MTARVGDTPSSFLLAQRQGLRRELRQRRTSLAPRIRRQQAHACARHALRALLSRKARRVAVYIAYGSELSTAPLIMALLNAGIEVFAPRLVRQQMRMLRLDESTHLQRNAYGIAEPCDRRQLRRSELDAMIIPLLGFDAAGNRLGTGGGYYDRFLEGSRRKPWRLGYAYQLQQCDALPAEAWDVPLHAVCTEHGLIRFPSVTTE